MLCFIIHIIIFENYSQGRVGYNDKVLGFSFEELIRFEAEKSVCCRVSWQEAKMIWSLLCLWKYRFSRE